MSKESTIIFIILIGSLHLGLFCLRWFIDIPQVWMPLLVGHPWLTTDRLSPNWQRHPPYRSVHSGPKDLTDVNSLLSLLYGLSFETSIKPLSHWCKLMRLGVPNRIDVVESNLESEFDRFKDRFKFEPRFRIGFVATSIRTAGIESKSRLKSDSNSIKVDLSI